MAIATWFTSFIRRLVNTQPIINQVNALREEVRWLSAEHDRAINLQYRDLLILLDRFSPFLNTGNFAIETAYPVAVDSHDHQYPRGTRQDNTRSPRFVAACERYFPHQIRYLDLGCSGGGMVLEFLLKGHVAAGLEGSNYSQNSLRAEWRVIPRHLMTCDISKPFQVTESNLPAKFHVITAWEVLEHIAQADIPQLLANVRRHLTEGGMFVGSVTVIQDMDPVTGAVYHRTVAPRDWWEQTFANEGWISLAPHPFSPYDYSRGTGNGWFDSDLNRTPELGFHFVLTPNPVRPQSSTGIDT